MHTYKTLVASFVLFTAQIVHADTVFLNDGTKREGTIVEDAENSVKLLVKHGPLSATVEIPRKEIARVEIKALAVNEDELNFQILGKEAERLAQLDPLQGAQAWLRYAKFCDEAPGYKGYAKAGYENALRFDSTLEEPRLALGYKHDGDGWHKPEVAKTYTVEAPLPFYPARSTYTAPLYVTTPDTRERLGELYSSPTRGSYSSNDSGYGYGGGGSYSSNRVIYLGSVNGRLQPVSASQFWYGNNSNSNYSTNTNTGYVQSGRTGYLSDGYYRSSGNGGSLGYVSGETGTNSSDPRAKRRY